MELNATNIASFSSLAIAVGGVAYLNSKMNSNIGVINSVVQQLSECQKRVDGTKKTHTQITQLVKVLKQCADEQSHLSSRIDSITEDIYEMESMILSNSACIEEIQSKTKDVSFNCRPAAARRRRRRPSNSSRAVRFSDEDVVREQMERMRMSKDSEY